MRAARRNAPRAARRRNRWVVLAGLVLALAAMIAAARMWSRRGERAADLGPDVDISGARESNGASRQPKKHSAQPAA